MENYTKENLIKSLNMFTSDEIIKEKLQNPFVQDNFLFASDGYTIIWFKSSMLDDLTPYTGFKTVNAMAVIPTIENVNIEIKTAVLKTVIEQSNKIAKEKYIKRIVICPDCNGSGEVEYEFRDYKYNTHRINYYCQTCDCAGKIEEIVDASTGDIIDGYNEYIQINGNRLLAKFVKRLWQVAVIHGFETISLVFQVDGYKQHFKIGEINVLLLSSLTYLDNGDLITVMEEVNLQQINKSTNQQINS